MKQRFLRGLKDGVPIGLGYLSVSFTFGIMAILAGLFWWQAVLISMLCVTSAGQLAGIQIMVSPGRYIEMLISQITINIRYSFMSISLSQKVSEQFKGIWRWIFSFMVTDEIFGVAVTKNEVTRSYFAGLCVVPYIGWTVGTLLGALLGNILPKSLMNALGIAIYAMFVAIVVPEIKINKKVIYAVVISAALSCIFRYVPVIKEVPTGIAISVCAILAAGVTAYIHPIEDDISEADTGISDQ